MSEVNIFEQATRKQLFFAHNDGVWSVYDLWKFRPDVLSDMYAKLQDKADVRNRGLMNKRTKADKEIDLKMAIIKHVYETKVAEAEKAKSRQEARRQRDNLLELKAESERNRMASMTPEEIQELIDGLDADLADPDELD